MKKSAEIAAIFSGAKINQTTDIVNDHEEDESSGNSTDDAYDSKRGQQCQCKNNCNTATSGGRFSGSDMHSSLGYFP